MSATETILARDHFGMKLGLDSIGAVCDELDRPERAYRTVIVAGTNGKGSVTAIAATALAAAGYRTGRYTSPHLVRLEERFALDGVDVSRDVVDEAAQRVLDAEARALARGRLEAPVTFFELTTAVAFEIFRRARVDVAVLEVGLGGRFDATNIASPAAAAITTIDLEHTRHLGTTLAAIAFEKAGVIKPGMVVVTGERKAEADAVIRAAVADRGATLVPAFEGVRHEVSIEGWRTILTLDTPAGRYGPLDLALRGRHQADNATVAVRLLESLAFCDLSVPHAAIERALVTTSWPGRLQLIDWNHDRQLLLDAAHNPAGMARLAEYLQEAVPGGLPVVLGVVNDKDARQMLQVLRPVATHLVVTEPPGSRAWPAAELASLARTLGFAAECHPDPIDAIDRAFGTGAHTVCVAGSIFLLGDVLGRAPTRG